MITTTTICVGFRDGESYATHLKTDMGKRGQKHSMNWLGSDIICGLSLNEIMIFGWKTNLVMSWKNITCLLLIFCT